MSGHDLVVYAELTHSAKPVKTGRIIIEDSNPEHGMNPVWYSFTPDEAIDFIRQLQDIVDDFEEHSVR